MILVSFLHSSSYSRYILSSLVRTGCGKRGGGGLLYLLWFYCSFSIDFLNLIFNLLSFQSCRVHFIDGLQDMIHNKLIWHSLLIVQDLWVLTSLKRRETSHLLQRLFHVQLSMFALLWWNIGTIHLKMKAISVDVMILQAVSLKWKVCVLPCTFFQ